MSVKATLDGDLCAPFLKLKCHCPTNHQGLTVRNSIIQHYEMKHFFQPNPHVPGSQTTGIRGTLSTDFRALDSALFLFALKSVSFWLTPHGTVLPDIALPLMLFTPNKKISALTLDDLPRAVFPPIAGLLFFQLFRPSWNHTHRGLREFYNDSKGSNVAAPIVHVYIHMDAV